MKLRNAIKTAALIGLCLAIDVIGVMACCITIYPPGAGSSALVLLIVLVPITAAVLAYYQVARIILCLYGCIGCAIFVKAFLTDTGNILYLSNGPPSNFNMVFGGIALIAFLVIALCFLLPDIIKRLD
jgi:hypothetical protein